MKFARGKRLYTLDGMRGVAAICVAVYHCEHVGIPLIAGGFRAVDFFFALSGLVIGRTYENKLRSTMNIGAFMTLRLIRLYPLYLIGSLLGLVSLVILPHALGAYGSTVVVTSTTTLFSVLMLPNISTLELYPVNFPAWSLLFELIINAIFAIVLVNIGTRALAIIAIASLVAFGLLVHHFGIFNLGTIWPHFVGGIMRVTFSFTVGVLIARSVTSTTRPTSWWMLAVVATLALSLALSSSARLDAALIAVAFPVILYISAKYELPSNMRTLCEWLGDISYPLYATHWPILFLWDAAAHKMGMLPLIEVVGFIAVTTGFATLLIQTDASMRAWITRWVIKSDRGAVT